MSVEVLGRSIADATKFLQAIHEDLRAQIRSLDRLMSDQGWRPVEDNKIGSGLGNSLNDGKSWVIDYLRRWYVRTDTSGSTDRVVAFVWYLYHNAGSPYEVPTLAAIACRVAAPQAANTFTQHDWEIEAVYKATAGCTTPIELTSDQVQPFLPTACSAAALVVPLCELTNEGVLQQRLVEPILAVAGRLTSEDTTI